MDKIKIFEDKYGRKCVKVKVMFNVIIDENELNPTKEDIINKIEDRTRNDFADDVMEGIYNNDIAIITG
jgi:hypothetical protein